MQADWQLVSSKAAGCRRLIWLTGTLSILKAPSPVGEMVTVTPESWPLHSSAAGCGRPAKG